MAILRFLRFLAGLLMSSDPAVRGPTTLWLVVISGLFAFGFILSQYATAIKWVRISMQAACTAWALWLSFRYAPHPILNAAGLVAALLYLAYSDRRSRKAKQ